MSQGVILLNKKGTRVNPGVIHTPHLPWTVHRNAIATVDTPSAAGNTRDAPDDPAERLVAYMVDTLEATITPIEFDDDTEINNLELRAHFSANSLTATGCVFAARKDEDTVRMIAELAWTAGTGETADGTARYFAKTTGVTQYWPKTINKSNDEATFGMSTIDFDMHGYNRFWVLIDALSGGNVTVEHSGY